MVLIAFYVLSKEKSSKMITTEKNSFQYMRYGPVASLATIFSDNSSAQ